MGAFRYGRRNRNGYRKRNHFTPAENPQSTGFIFYPGGKVDAEAYAQLAHGLADGGVLSVIVKMPFDLAVFNSGAQKE